MNASGSGCPMALKLIACLLLLEITTFLRECYRTLPRPTRAQTRSANFWGDLRGPLHQQQQQQSLNPVSASGRRWSMAAQSIAGGQSIASQSPQPPSHLPGLQPGGAVSGSTELGAPSPSTSHAGSLLAGAAPPEHPRKISFVLQEDIQTFNSNQATATLSAPQVSIF